MNVNLITKEVAYHKYLELKDLAFSIAEANGTLPGYCNAPECKAFNAFAAISTELKEGEVCIFIDNLPAEQLTQFEVSPGSFAIGKICAVNVREAKIEDGILLVYYHDGVIEKYCFIEDLGVWKFDGKNITINVPSTSAN